MKGTGEHTKKGEMGRREKMKRKGETRDSLQRTRITAIEKKKRMRTTERKEAAGKDKT